MQKHLFTALLTATSFAGWSQAPIPVGTVQLGGSVGYYQRHSEDATYNSSIMDYYTAGITPQVGYFVAPGWVLGLSAGYGSGKQTYATTGTSYYNTQRYKSYQLGPFVQRYHMLTDQFGLTGTLATSYAHSTSDTQGLSSYDFYTSSGTSNGLTAALTPGLVYLPIRQLALGASMGSLAYSYAQGSQRYADGSTHDTKGSDFGASFGLSYLTLSGTYYFRRD